MISCLAVLCELRYRARKSGIVNVESVATLDFAKYVTSKRSGDSLEYWTIARRRMYDAELERLEKVS